MDDETLLTVAYRGRPTTIDELTTLSHAPAEEVAATVDRLLAQGRLSGSRDRFDYPNPAVWAADSVADRAAEFRQTAGDLLGEIERLVADLPRMIGHWSIGETSGEPMPVVMRHGPRAVEDVWFELGQRDVGTLEAVLPDISRFLSSPDERVTRFSEAFRSKEAVRVIIPRPSAEDPAMSQLLLAFTAAGMTYRFSEAPPSWFWVDGDQLAVPVEWGEKKPTSVLSVRSAALAALASAYFATLWDAAAPSRPAEAPWTPLLTLMRKGITLETASRMVNINPRTGRRRIAQAMSHYGVSTLFALGVAWAADAESRA